MGFAIRYAAVPGNRADLMNFPCQRAYELQSRLSGESKKGGKIPRDPKTRKEILFLKKKN